MTYSAHDNSHTWCRAGLADEPPYRLGDMEARFERLLVLVD